MRILILANTDKGLYKFRKELISELIDDGNEVYISIPEGIYKKDLIDLGCNYIKTDVDRRGVNPLTDIKLLMSYRRIIKRIAPDKVITYTIKPNIYGGVVCRLKNIQMYANVTGLGTAFQGGGMLTNLVTVMYRFALKKVKTVFFENKGNRDIIVKKGIVPKEKTYCLNGAGVNTEKFEYREYPQGEEIHFLFIGRIMKEKGIGELFEATAHIKRTYKNVVLDVIGNFEEDYEETVKRLEEEKIINYYGYQADVRPVIEKAHCFVLPSWHEGMANTLLECGAMGRPIITSNIHGCMEAVEDGKNGFLCNVKDAEDLYRKMEQFIELPYDKKVEMGKHSHEFISSKFDKKQVVKETIAEIMRD